MAPRQAWAHPVHHRLRKLLPLLRRRLPQNPDAHQLSSEPYSEAILQILEHRKRFRLVFNQRIALSVSAEADNGPQMIQRFQMLPPQRI